MERRNVVALLGWILALAPMAQAQGARAQTARAQARALPVRAQAGASHLLLRPTRYELDASVDFGEERLSGRARIALVNGNARPVREASFTLYRLLKVSAVRDGQGRPLAFSREVVAYEDEPLLQVEHVRVPLVPALPPGGRITLELSYGGYLAGYVETGMLYVKDRVDSAFTIIRDDAQAYPVPNVPADSVRRNAGYPAFDYVARITVPSSHVVANGGRLVTRTEAGGRATYEYRSIKPSSRMDFAIARFGVVQRGPLRVFHLPGDSAGGARALEAMERTLARYTARFGPLAGDPGFTVIEVPDGWGSQADVTSILQSAAAFRDTTRMGELYHEISHLWNVASTENPAPRWNEGLATFLEYLTAAEVDHAKPIEDRAEEYATWLRGKAAHEPGLARVAPADYGRERMTDYSYSVGMLAFYGLYRLAGPEAFNRMVGDYYARYHETGAGTRELEESARRASTVDLAPFFRDWFFTPAWAGRLAKYGTFREVIASYGPSASRAP